jgi:hypothetical protein
VGLKSRSPRWWAFAGQAALGLAGLSICSATRTDAEVVVDGARDQMRVSVENETLGQVLDALRRKANLRFRSTVPLNNVIGGSFSGSLGQVLSRILVGFDFVLVYKPQGVEIVVYRQSGAKPILSPSEAPQPEKASTVAEQAPPGASLAPRLLLPPAPSQYDLATSNVSMRR